MLCSGIATLTTRAPTAPVNYDLGGVARST